MAHYDIILIEGKTRFVEADTVDIEARLGVLVDFRSDFHEITVIPREKVCLHATAWTLS